jgi:hypothetical protein
LDIDVSAAANRSQPNPGSMPVEKIELLPFPSPVQLARALTGSAYQV